MAHDPTSVCFHFFAVPEGASGGKQKLTPVTKARQQQDQFDDDNDRAMHESG